MRTTLPRLLAALLAVGALAGPAGALDLTGTWEIPSGDARCRYFHFGTGRWTRAVDGNLARLAVSQVGLDVYLENGTRTDAVYSNHFAGRVVEDPGRPEKGVAAATSCSVGGEAYRGVLFVRKARADADGGAMLVEWKGTSVSNVLECKGKFVRTSSADPAVAASCP